MLAKTLVSTLLWVFLVYLAYCALLYLVQRQIVFPAGLTGPAAGPPALPGLEVIEVRAGGIRTEAWFLPPAAAKGGQRHPAILFAHGNAELIDGCLGEFMPFTRLGAGLLLVEYPGYGRSRGSPSQAGIGDVYAAAYDWLAARPDVDSDRIVLAGRSLGGGVACDLAAKRPSAAMILISTFTSARAFAVRYLAPGFLVRDPFDNLSVVRSYEKPVLVFHGRGDDVIPYAHGAALAAASSRSRLVTLDCAHNDCPPDRAAFFQEAERFLRGAGVLPPAP
ncbi:alpha/beta hydrolase [Desulfococcus sp.]|uniref:alpha/beta hydrolase n=1 Tax=Desulfococcus sp. TaxID=2025834 RepID=UPI00359364EE